MFRFRNEFCLASREERTRNNCFANCSSTPKRDPGSRSWRGRWISNMCCSCKRLLVTSREIHPSFCSFSCRHSCTRQPTCQIQFAIMIFGSKCYCVSKKLVWLHPEVARRRCIKWKCRAGLIMVLDHQSNPGSGTQFGRERRRWNECDGKNARGVAVRLCTYLRGRPWTLAFQKTFKMFSFDLNWTFDLYLCNNCLLLISSLLKV